MLHAIYRWLSIIADEIVSIEVVSPRVQAV